MKPRNPNKASVQDDYFDWLCDLVTLRQRGDREMLMQLHGTKFTWLVRNDDNRAEDGKQIRKDFAREVLGDQESIWEGDCTVLEMMVALAKRMAYLMPLSDPGTVSRIFHEFVQNLGLQPIVQPDREEKAAHNAMCVTRFLDRDYKLDGSGGLFPLRNYDRDQRKVEIWYQLMSYINERYPMDF